MQDILPTDIRNIIENNVSYLEHKDNFLDTLQIIKNITIGIYETEHHIICYKGQCRHTYYKKIIICKKCDEIIHLCKCIVTEPIDINCSDDDSEDYDYDSDPVNNKDCESDVSTDDDFTSNIDFDQILIDYAKYASYKNHINKEINNSKTRYIIYKYNE